MSEYERLSHLPSNNDEYFFCMICLTKIKERYDNFTLQKKNIPELALYDAITPYAKDFNELCSKFKFHSILNSKKGTKALWLSQLEIFKYFLNSEHKYLVLLEDDAVVPSNLKELLDKDYINHGEFLQFGGTRLGQYASCNLYNKHCIKNILETIKTYPIDRGLDHYASNIPSGTGEKRPHILKCSLYNLPKILTQVNPYLSKKSVRLYYDHSCKNTK